MFYMIHLSGYYFYNVRYYVPYYDHITYIIISTDNIVTNFLMLKKLVYVKKDF
jgi:hypothetical protein